MKNCFSLFLIAILYYQNVQSSDSVSEKYSNLINHKVASNCLLVFQKKAIICPLNHQMNLLIECVVRVKKVKKILRRLGYDPKMLSGIYFLRKNFNSGSYIQEMGY